jgi:hypothetical protein
VFYVPVVWIASYLYGSKCLRKYKVSVTSTRKNKSMKAVTISVLKKELAGLSSRKILEICLRLAKYRKENKELLTYLLFDSGDEEEYIRKVKSEIDLQLEEMNKSNLYYVKKSLRKTLRITNKYIRYSGNKQTEVELLLYFCRKFNELKIPVHKSVTLSNMYQRQLQKIKKAAGTLHEDLQFDYDKEVEQLVR